jgi:hypothetical protein
LSTKGWWRSIKVSKASGGLSACTKGGPVQIEEATAIWEDSVAAVI